MVGLLSHERPRARCLDGFGAEGERRCCQTRALQHPCTQMAALAVRACPLALATASLRSQPPASILHWGAVWADCAPVCLRLYAEFEENGLGGLVTVTQRDIEEGGFPEDMHGRADGVFLDLPKPYKVRWHGRALLRWGLAPRLADELCLDF